MDNGGCLMHSTLFIIFRWCTIESKKNKFLSPHIVCITYYLYTHSLYYLLLIA